MVKAVVLGWSGHGVGGSMVGKLLGNDDEFRGEWTCQEKLKGVTLTLTLRLTVFTREVNIRGFVIHGVFCRARPLW